MILLASWSQRWLWRSLCFRQKDNLHIRCKKINICSDVSNELAIWCALLTTRIFLRIHTAQDAFDKTFGDPKSNSYQLTVWLFDIQRTIDALFYEMMHYFTVNVLLIKPLILTSYCKLKLSDPGAEIRKKELNRLFSRERTRILKTSKQSLWSFHVFLGGAVIPTKVVQKYSPEKSLNVTFLHCLR